MTSQSETFGRAPAFEAVTHIKPPALPGVSDSVHRISYYRRAYSVGVTTLRTEGSMELWHKDSGIRIEGAR